MHIKEIRINILLMTVIGAAFLYMLSSMVGGAGHPDAMNALMPVVATFVGALGTTLITLSSPQPNIEAHAAATTLVAYAIFGKEGGAERQALSTVDGGWRRNLIAIVIAGGAFVLVIAWMIADVHLVSTLAGAYIGALAGLMADLVRPEPEPTVPVSVIEEMIRAR